MTQPPLQPVGSPPPAQNDDKKQSDPNNKPISVSSGGPEGQSVSIEQPGSKGGAESNGDILKPAEKSTEVKAEKQTQPQKKQKPARQKPQKKKAIKKKIIGLQPKNPIVYGYKIPPEIGSNPKLIAKKAGKGNMKTGEACLYVFLDRLLKMNKKK